ncbi:hypothetical protein [Mycolicibacterium fallax]|uniref:Uncharacterized protein n=1 Tax=Mycolicibacterium fallax TaxID=1793 RepID=A0A1X1R3W6_MYCFA|nr:hypothetical protein [Mycolicibacterium fallax]ORU98996.1 hypothetical protein AWC04_17920 [Mycolicibacterium fallax]BBZ00103.1 hypothetical protein MFAL_35690 [Mycolicibacterium fallax]
MTDAEPTLDPLAARLLEAQVQFSLEQLRGENYHALVFDEVDHFLTESTQITLAESVTPAMIKDTAAKYAVQVPVEGAIPELVGEIAARLYALTVAAETPIGELLDGPRFGELAATVAEMEATHRVLDRVLNSEEFADLCATLVRHAIADGARESGGPLARIGARLLRAGDRFGHRTERLARRGTRFVLARMRADEDLLVDTVTELWRRNLDAPVASVRSVLTGADIEDVIVLVFEFWRSFRDTEYFRALLDAGIDGFFDKYGDTSLYELLAELGVGREDLIEEGLRFGPPVLGMLDERGFLAQLLRRRLRPFYASEGFRAALAGD